MNFKESFPPTSKEQWESAIEKLLKGKDYNDTLVWKTEEGFDIQPYYRKEDLPERSYPLFHKKDNNWFIREEIVVEDEKKANKEALNALMKGANAIAFVCSSSPDLTVLLNEIATEFAPVSVYIPQADAALAASFSELNKNENGGVFVDVFGGLLSGTETINPGEKLNALEAHINAGGKLLIDACNYRNASSNITQELAFTLSSIIEIIESSSLNINTIAKNTEVVFGLASNYFFEIAKLKSFTYLLEKSAEAYGVQIDEHPTYSAKSSNVNRSIYDPHVNMLRGSSEAMSAGIAGYDNITILPFDSEFKKADDFSRRIARNISLMLQEESFFTQVVDPASGSYYIEHLVDQFITSAWDLFLELEKNGGYLKSLESNLIQDKIEAHANQILEKVESVEKTILGVNKHPNPEDKMKAKMTIQASSATPSELSKTFKPLQKVRWAEKLENKRLSEEN